MQPVTPTQHLQGRLVAVGPGLLDIVLEAGPADVERLLAQLAFATEHRFRIEVRGSGPLAGAHGRITSAFAVGADGAVAQHEVVLSIHPAGGSPT